MKLLLYCTKSRYRLFYDYIGNKYRYGLDEKKDKFNAFNGKIVAECDYEIEEIKLTSFLSDKETYQNEKELLEKSCLTYKELADYVGGNKGYAIHIKNLHIFDKPRELSDYYIIQNENVNPIDIEEDIKTVKKAPQNMMYCWEFIPQYRIFKEQVLISIHPEWLCKILNGEKTIEVRKKVLKEML